jgi:transcriptional regulator with XRE-family HTH domain
MTALDPDRAREAMELAGHDQSSLAREIGVTPGTIHQLLAGKIQRSRFMPEIAEALGVSLRWLRGEDVSRDPEADASILPAASSVRHLMMHVALPSEDALTEMFEALLELERPEDTKAERARLLAQLLPAALAQLQSRIPVGGAVAAIAGASAPRSPAAERRARR